MYREIAIICKEISCRAYVKTWMVTFYNFIQVTDACTACFEQRTVFTQQVLAKALNQMVLPINCIYFLLNIYTSAKGINCSFLS